jgi:MOSC domain-containing protein YiiM
MASVVNLFVSPAIGQPMQARTSVRAFAGRGLEGDRYEHGEGSYSKLARVAARHVSLIAREAIESANGELVERGLLPFEINETRRNIVVEGVDVYGLLGKEFRIGGVRLRGSEPTRPCHIPSAVAGKAGFAQAYRDRGGVRAEVLSDGIVSIGDLVQTD